MASAVRGPTPSLRPGTTTPTAASPTSASPGVRAGCPGPELISAMQAVTSSKVAVVSAAQDATAWRLSTLRDRLHADDGRRATGILINRAALEPSTDSVQVTLDPGSAPNGQARLVATYGAAGLVFTAPAPPATPASARPATGTGGQWVARTSPPALRSAEPLTSRPTMARQLQPFWRPVTTPLCQRSCRARLAPTSARRKGGCGEGQPWPRRRRVACRPHCPHTAVPTHSRSR